MGCAVLHLQELARLRGRRWRPAPRSGTTCSPRPSCSTDGLRLGPVGGRIVGEVFIGLLQLDPGATCGVQPNWRPTLPSQTPGDVQDDRPAPLGPGRPGQPRPVARRIGRNRRRDDVSVRFRACSMVFTSGTVKTTLISNHTVCTESLVSARTQGGRCDGHAGLDDRSVRIAIRSDRRLFHDTLAACLALRPDFGVVVGHVTSGQDLLDLCRLRRPDIVAVRRRRRHRDQRARARRTARQPSHGPPDPHLRAPDQSRHRARGRLGIDALVPHSHGLDALQALVQRHAEALRTQIPSRRPTSTASPSRSGRSSRRSAPGTPPTGSPNCCGSAAARSRTPSDGSTTRCGSATRAMRSPARPRSVWSTARRAAAAPVDPGAALRVVVYAHDTLDPPPPGDDAARLRHPLRDRPGPGADHGAGAWSGPPMEPWSRCSPIPSRNCGRPIDDIDVPVLLVARRRCRSRTRWRRSAAASSG